MSAISGIRGAPLGNENSSDSPKESSENIITSFFSRLYSLSFGNGDKTLAQRKVSQETDNRDALKLFEVASSAISSANNDAQFPSKHPTEDQSDAHPVASMLLALSLHIFSIAMMIHSPNGNRYTPFYDGLA